MTKPKSKSSNSKTSKSWLNEHFNDQYVQRAQKDGYRSRASYKLLELIKKDRLLAPGMTVVDLGSAPGGWAQVAAQKVGVKGKVVATDILLMDCLAEVTFIQGDFTEADVFEELLREIGPDKADLVMSDMAPNMSGMSDVDQPRAMYLVELALDMACNTLRPQGHFVAKVFQGEGFDAFLKDVRHSFKTVVTRKPSASRARSREVYVVGKGFIG
jgi:23S rRNA (uridine2552-2'-O)-methyltransferase